MVTNGLDKIEVRIIVCCAAQSCLTVCGLMVWSLPGSSVHGDSPGRSTGVGCHALLQGIFPTQRSNPELPHCRQILYCLSHEGSRDSMDRILIPTRSSVLEEERSKSKSSSRTITILYIAESHPGALINSVENSYIEGSKWTVVLMVYDSSRQPHHHHGRW